MLVCMLAPVKPFHLSFFPQVPTLALPLIHVILTLLGAVNVFCVSCCDLYIVLMHLRSHARVVQVEACVITSRPSLFCSTGI